MILNLNEKIKLIQNYIKKYDVDGMLLFSPINRLWFLDYHSSYGWLFISKTDIIYIVDSRYFLEAKTHLQETGVQVWNIRNNLIELFNNIKNEYEVKTLLIESDYINLSTLDIICKAWNFKNLIAFKSSSLREVKFQNELESLQKSADITVDVFNWLLTKIKPNMTEKEIAKMISIKFLELGASANSFDPIVAANINGANPHHKCTDYKIQDGDMITIDLGCMYNNYASDMTRTFVLGNQCNSKEMLEIYKIVQKANELGIKNATNNISGHDLDQLVRNYIDNTKYKNMFSHGLGHGVGLEVHELPNANSTNKIKFENNNVITVEPGIYCENIGGVRIEDTIVIKENKPIVLTKGASKELIFVDYSKN